MGRGRGVQPLGFGPPGAKKCGKHYGFSTSRLLPRGPPPINEVKLRLRPSLDQAWLALERRSAHPCFALAAARRSSKEIASVSCDCWSRGGVYILHGLCFGYSFRLRDDEREATKQQSCVFFLSIGGTFLASRVASGPPEAQEGSQEGFGRPSGGPWRGSGGPKK